MPSPHARTIHFSDTDAAGVVYFANYLSICHDAYEEALGEAGIELKSFFDGAGVIVPIAKSEAAYHRPLNCGDKLKVTVQPALLAEDTYEIRFEIVKLGPPQKVAARVRTEHVCLDEATRKRIPLPAALAAWVNTSR